MSTQFRSMYRQITDSDQYVKCRRGNMISETARISPFSCRSDEIAKDPKRRGEEIQEASTWEIRYLPNVSFFPFIRSFLKKKTLFGPFL